MALEPCVLTILRTLSVATLRGICDAIAAQKVVADFRVTKLLVHRTQVQLQTIKLDAVQALYAPVVAKIQEGLSFYPTGVARLVNTCAQFGDFLEAPQEIVTSLLATANNVIYRVREYTAIIDDINTEIDRLNSLTTLLDEICALSEIIIVELTTPAAP